MNLTELPSRLLPLAGADAAAPVGAGVAARLQAATGHQLLELNVWADTAAAERLLGARIDANAPPATQLDLLVNHILAPLG